MCKWHACHYHCSYQDVTHQHILKMKKEVLDKWLTCEVQNYKIISNKEKEEEAVLDIPHKGRSSELVFSASHSRPKEIRTDASK